MEYISQIEREALIKQTAELIDLFAAVPEALQGRINCQDLLKQRDRQLDSYYEHHKRGLALEQHNKKLTEWQKELWGLLLAGDVLRDACKECGAKLLCDEKRIQIVVPRGQWERTIADIQPAIEYTTYPNGSWRGETHRGQFAEVTIDSKRRRYSKHAATGHFNVTKIQTAIIEELRRHAETVKYEKEKVAKKQTQVERCIQDLGDLVTVKEEAGGYYSDYPRKRTWIQTSSIKLSADGVTGDLNSGPNKDGLYTLSLHIPNLTLEQAREILQLAKR